MEKWPCILLFLMLMWSAPCKALQVNYVDTSHCKLQHFNAKTIATYKTDPAFNYETKTAGGEGVWGLIVFLIARFLERLFSVHAGSIGLGDVLTYGLMIFSAIAIVLYIFKVPLGNIFARNPTNLVNYVSEVENIHQTDFETLIAEARNKKNYRLAIRLFYLNTLRKLSEAGLINWQKNKTNFEYYYELRGDHLRKPFYNLTLLFESAWYGNHEITEDIFNQNSDAFTGFLQSIRR